MGEYEDRYPEAYGRIEETPPSAPPAQPTQPASAAAESPRPLLRDRLGVSRAAERVRAWQHRPADRAATVETPAIVRREETVAAAAAGLPAAPLAAAEPSRAAAPMSLRRPGTFRGVGPRGYARSAERIREDICDRLTENPFIDASDMEVFVGGSEVRLTGTVDSLIASHQAQAIAEEVAGVTHVHNQLQVRPRGDLIEPTPGDQINAALGAGPSPRT